jgi:hypothetical protein
MIFRSDDNVVVIGKEMPGSIGYVDKVLNPFVDNTVPTYTLRQNPDNPDPGIFKNKTFRGEDLVLVDNGQRHSQFDFTRYLTAEQVTVIAERVCEKEVTEYVNQALKSRTNGHQGGIVDQILTATARTYTEKFAPTFEESFIERCHEEILRDAPITNNEQCFRQSLAWELSKTAGKYIEANSELIQTEMKDLIHEQAKLLCSDKLTYEIGKRIKVQDLILEVLKDNYGDHK